jgi:hypothetical protein
MFLALATFAAFSIIEYQDKRKRQLGSREGRVGCKESCLLQYSCWSITPDSSVDKYTVSGLKHVELRFVTNHLILDTSQHFGLEFGIASTVR